MRPWTLAAGAALLAVGFAPLGAAAQTPTSPQQAPNMPAPQNVPAEKVAPSISSDTPSQSGQTLSDKLERSEGVIKPPPMSGGMVVEPPVPNPGTTPVIPPPGTSPSDPVQPK